MSSPSKRLLIAHTEGNPFFLEESVRTLVETGVLGGERGAYRLEHAVWPVRVPATVQAVLAARIDRLAPEDKGLLPDSQRCWVRPCPGTLLGSCGRARGAHAAQPRSPPGRGVPL